MSKEALEVILGLIFAILGFAILIRLKKLTKSHYYRYLFIAIGILLIGFAIYLALEGIFINY